MGDVKGIVGEKVGMTQIFDETRAVPVTVIKAGPCVVAQVRSQGDRRVRRGPARLRPDASPRHQPPDEGPLRQGAGPRRSATSSNCGPTTPPRTPPAKRYGPTSSRRETAVDVVGVSKGKGFTGVMKRHGFSGLKGSHGRRRSTVRRGRSAPAPPRRVSSRACAWPDSPATSA